jgi:hypothetical protein
VIEKMDKLNELQKEIISDKIFKMIDNFNDNELDYALYVMEFWKKERKRQEEEIKELYKEQ